MSTIAREFTKEQLQQIIETDHVQCGEASSLARIALASLEAEPVAYIIQDADARSRGEKGILRYFANISDEDINEYQITVTPLYTAPTAPVSVPDNRAITQHFDTIALETAREIMCDVNRRHEFLGGEVQLLSRIQCRIDDACRAAMLQGANDSLTHEGKNHPEDKLGMTNIIPRYPVGTLVKLFPDGVATGTVMYVIMDEPPRYHVQWDDGTHSYPAQRDLKRVGTLYDGLD